MRRGSPGRAAGLLFFLVLLLLAPAVSWAAATLLVRVDNQSPYAGPLQKLVATPDFLLFSDGTVFYSRHAEELGQVEYYTAQITQDEISTVVSRLQLGGAADWEDSYENATLQGLPTTTFALTAPGLKNTISVYGAAWSARQKQLPDALGWLYDYVSNFHNNGEKPFVPTHATLYVKHLFGSSRDKDKDTQRMTIKWTPKVDLAKAAGGTDDYKSIELDGRVATDAWNALHGVALPTMLAPKVVFSQKRDLYQLGIRPQVPSGN